MRMRAQNLHLKPANGSQCSTSYVWPLCGTLIGKTELKVSCTKNFKALYVNFPKYTAPGFEVLVLKCPCNPLSFPESYQLILL